MASRPRPRTAPVVLAVLVTAGLLAGAVAAALGGLTADEPPRGAPTPGPSPTRAIPSLPPSPEPREHLAFGPSGLEGGGFVNVVEVDPRGTGLVLAGGDVSGFHRSTDWGRTWTPANRGLDGLDRLRVASILFWPTDPDLVFAAVGRRGSGGGLLVSTDAGLSWTVRSTVPRFSGSNNGGVADLPPKHPRSTGELLAADPAAGMLYAGTFDRGVLASPDGGWTWDRLGPPGGHVRSLVVDPSDPSILYAAAYGRGVWRTSAGPEGEPFRQLPGSPPRTEELVAISGRVFAAAGPDGVYAASGGGRRWERLQGLGPGVWLSIAGYRRCGEVVLYAGSDGAAPRSVMRSTDGGATWDSLSSDPAQIRRRVRGSSSRWWVAQEPRFLLGDSFYTAAHVAIAPARDDDPCLLPRVLVAGRSGIWSSEDAGLTWLPSVRGLGATIVRAVAPDPDDPARLSIAAADWVFLSSTDAGRSVRMHRPRGGPTGFALALDPHTTPTGIVVATGSPRGNHGGEVFSSQDQTAGARWVDEGLSDVAGGRRPLAVAIGRPGGARVLLAAVDGGGIWRKAGGTWVRTRSGAFGVPGVRAASFAWPPGSRLVYAFDGRTGLWRSRDAGRTWIRVWGRPSNADMTGSVAVRSADPETAFLSLAGGLFRLDGAGSGTVGGGAVEPVRIGPLRRPGPIAVDDDGALFVAELPSRGRLAAVYRSDDGGETWSRISDDAYAATGGMAFALAVARDGTVAVGLNGNGMVLGRP